MKSIMSHSSPNHPQHMVGIDRHQLSSKLLSPTSKVHLSSPSVRSHSLQGYPHQTPCASNLDQSAPPTTPLTSSISSHSIHAGNPLAYSPINNNASHIKYDLGHHNQHHHSPNPHHHHAHQIQHSSPANNGNYLHSVGATSHASMYGVNVNGVKTEGTVSTPTGVNGNYEYMNSCLQNGYFGGTFSSLGASANAHHMGTDLTGYHHQHSAIQAAKLMATS